MAADIGEALSLASQGYRRVSTKHQLVSRVDRPDWREYMAMRHCPHDPEGLGNRWVMCLGKGAADHYRRVYSKDTLNVLNLFTFRLIPASANDDVGYVP